MVLSFQLSANDQWELWVAQGFSPAVLPYP